MRGLIATFYSAMERYMFWLNLPQHVTKTDIVEIIIIAFLLYHVLVWVKNTRAWALFKGILVVLIFILIAAIFQMSTILWLASKLFSIGVIALVVIFQPELRKALEQLGRTNILASLFSLGSQKQEEDTAFNAKTAAEIVRACYEMGKVKTGALIVIERETPLTEYIRTGIDVDAKLTSQLLINIFEHNTPLHDGAVIVRGNRIVSATCYLPLSDNYKLSKDLGTRHRAGVGVSEVSDSLTVIVSEETGGVSLAVNGVLHRNVEADYLKEELIQLMDAKSTENHWVFKLKRRLSDAAEDSKDHNK